MLIRYRGHAEFLLQSGQTRMLTDPYDDHVGYRTENTEADFVTVSHGHGDHAYTQKVTGDPVIVNRTGTCCPAPGVTLTGIESVHDDKDGTLRGQNIIFVAEWEDLRIVHLGDQGTALTEEQLGLIGTPDILFIPVGGFFTIDGGQAAAIVRQLKPRITIPMHYKTKVNASWPIGDESAFLQAMGVKDIQSMPLIRVTKGDISCQPGVVLLTPECI